MLLECKTNKLCIAGSQLTCSFCPWRLSVVNHHGARVIGGHYTADVFHSGLQLWIRLDDSSVRVVSAEKVVQFEPPRFPYLLYYRRKDLN